MGELHLELDARGAPFDEEPPAAGAAGGRTYVAMLSDVEGLVAAIGKALAKSRVHHLGRAQSAAPLPSAIVGALGEPN